MIALSTPLAKIHGIGPRFLYKLKKLGIETVKDLLWHFPSRYEDFSQIYSIVDLIPNQEATIQGVIKQIGGRRTWRSHLYLVEALISDDTGSIRAVWFNQPYIKNTLRPGKLANFSGKVVLGGKENELYLSNPVYELISSQNYADQTQINAESLRKSAFKHTGRIVPIYPETKGLTSKGLRYLIKPILDNLPRLPEIIPAEILQKEKLPEINEALRKIHFPDDLDEALLSKKRFAFEDLFFLQLYNLEQKLKLAQEKSVEISIDIEEIKKLIRRLPFELTISQKKSLWEILQNLAKPHPMNRLLQGDVGSGKTIVAAIAATIVARRGHQSAFMAPTEILARQHYKTFTSFFPDFEDGLALLTGSEAKTYYGRGLETDVKKPSLKRDIEEGKIKIVIGTHALIQKNITLPNLALVVVDEQHRFGVAQRAALLKANHESRIKNGVENKNAVTRNSKFLIPHLLSMSATPIPRTLSLTLFSDLDLSLITELPKDRKPIITKVVAPANREQAYAFIRGQIKKGRQAFVICPRIEQVNVVEVRPPGGSTSQILTSIRKEVEPRKIEIELEVKSVKQEYEKLSKKVFPDLRVAMLHGKMKSKDKEKVMKEFSEGKSDILVSTSVVEVGVDIPNATIMMIEGSEQFGLAQLYQFRGRVGRGEHQSFCFLFTDSSSKTTHQRLKSIVQAKNGFELAEQDLKIRGPGEFLGQAQTGMPDLAMKALQNPEFVKSSREAAWSILQKDRSLKTYPSLRNRLAEFQKEVHWE